MQKLPATPTTSAIFPPESHCADNWLWHFLLSLRFRATDCISAPEDSQDE